MTTSTVTTPAATTSVLQWLEGDVIALIQDFRAGAQVIVADLTSGLSWLGSHIGEIAMGITAVQGIETQFNAAGIPIPSALANGISAINSAVTGVNAALTGQAIASNAGQALSDGYQATKALQIAVAGAAQIAATLAPVPATTATPAASS